jgi:sugar lactone lactonase YvrE
VEPDGTLVTHADLSPYAGGDCNDMVVDAHGNAYVGNHGFDLRGGEKPAEATLVLVTPDGEVRPVAGQLRLPNAAVITPDGRTLILAETMGKRITAFDIGSGGSLSGRRLVADLNGARPDGMCLDAEGAVWVAIPAASEYLRLREGGEVLDRIAMPGHSTVACMLGGADRRTLFLLNAHGTAEDRTRGTTTSTIWTVRVDVPGAGYP